MCILTLSSVSMTVAAGVYFGGACRSMMNKITSILMMSTLSAAGSVGAQQLYKSVGPDGKVVFADRPANDAKAKVSTMQSYVLRPVEAPVAKKEAVAKAEAPAEFLNDALVTPEHEESMLKIMELVDFGRKFEPFCAASETSTKTFAAAHKAWLRRNALYVEHQKRLLMEVVTPTRRMAMQNKLATRVGQVALKPTASAAVRAEWCDSISTELNSGRSDIVKPAFLALPLPVYKTK